MTAPETARHLITHLRHVDIAVPDHDVQVEFYASQWGLAKVGADSGVTYLAPEGSPEQYQVRVRQADEKRLDLIAFGAANAADVDELAARLGRDGVTLVTEPGAMQTPGGGYGFRFFDNDGRTVEISADVAVRQHRKIEEGESVPVKLSHVVLNSPNPEETVAFYDKHLSFRVSDTIMHPGWGKNLMWFLRCNPQHHSLAIARGPHTSLHHASFELRGIDEYMRGTGRLLRAGVTKIWGPGRHKAGNNTFSYFLDPHGNTMEYTTELELLDEDTWHPHLYDFTDPMVSDQWGTANKPDELVGKASFNDVDKGVFVAPSRMTTAQLDTTSDPGDEPEPAALSGVPRPGRLAGKVAVITGTGSGQGRAAALLFAAEGATVVGCDLHGDHDAETAALVTQAGGTMTSTVVDLTDDAAVATWAADTLATHGRVDVLYANAAATRFGPLPSFSFEDWRFAMTAELDVVFLPVKHFWTALAASGSGAIVLVGSTAGVTGSTTNMRIAHTAAKGGVVAMTKQLAAEGAPHGIRANCVSPGMIATPATARNLLAPDHPMNTIWQAIPLRRIGTPEDVVRCALFLASDEASYVTGANLMVDGGWSAVLPS